MNYAAVKVTGSGASKLEGNEDMFVGNMNLPGRIKTGECRSKAGLALVYPNPGPAITITPVSGIPFGHPTSGACYVGPGKGKCTRARVVIQARVLVAVLLLVLVVAAMEVVL